VFEDWRRKGARLGELLAFSRIRPAVGVESQGALNL
jgi:type III restriction enzyme